MELGFAISPTTPTDSRRRPASTERAGGKDRTGLTLPAPAEGEEARRGNCETSFLLDPVRGG